MGEKTYEPNESPYEVMELVRWMKPEILDSFSAKYVCEYASVHYLFVSIVG